MAIEWLRPYAGLLLPVCLLAVWAMDRFLGRPYKGRKANLARILRVVLICLLVAALSGPMLLLPSRQAATWAVCDVSASAKGMRGAMETALAQGLDAAPKDLQTGVIAFGRNAMVDTPLSAGRKGARISASPAEDQTDIGRALDMALALLPQDAAGRLVLLSDGENHVGNIDTQISSLRARGIAVDVLPLTAAFQRDAQVTSLTPPAQAYEGERFDVVVRMDANADMAGTLVLYANRQPVATREITLRKGENTFIFQDTAKEAGVVTYEAQLIAPEDECAANNRMSAYMDVRGTPQVLVVEGQNGASAELRAMLKAAGIGTETLLPMQLPATAEALRKYHAVALVNVDADALPEKSIAALSDDVRMLGRGLVVLGGDSSYALGGYRGSALEEMLPVTMDVDNRMDMPSLSLVLVIDKSGSMTEGRFGVTRLDMAKEAAMRSCEVLTARDQVGVIAFDDTAKWAVPMQGVENVASIQEMIGTIRPGGGTAFYSALQQSLQVLMESKSQLKHVIFLTDGEPGDSGYESIVQQMAGHGITLTTVAVGGGANATLLRKLSETGGGRAYVAGEFDDIPKVFTKETYLATQAYAQNRTFYPVIYEESTLTRYDGFPALHGYMATTKKPLATVSLATDREDPLLAWWQYGAGRVVAWTSDVQGAWTGDFLRWENAAAFFGGMVSFVLPVEAGEGEIAMERTGDLVTMRYTVRDEEAGTQTVAQVLQPDGTPETITMQSVAPGVYEGEMQIKQEGAYAVRVEQRRGETLLRTLESGIAVGYSAEYDLRAQDGGALLANLAERTGGRVLTAGSELFSQRGTQTRARWNATLLLLWLSLALFVLDVAQRRLAWERWIPERTQKPAKEKKAIADVRKPVSPRKPTQTDAPLPPSPVTDTADKLLASRKKKLL